MKVFEARDVIYEYVTVRMNCLLLITQTLYSI